MSIFCPSKDETYDLSLWRICQAGAEAQRKDPNIVPQFCILPSEIDKVRGYMAKHYPETRYLLA